MTETYILISFFSLLQQKRVHWSNGDYFWLTSLRFASSAIRYQWRVRQRARIFNVSIGGGCLLRAWGSVDQEKMKRKRSGEIWIDENLEFLIFWACWLKILGSLVEFLICLNVISLMRLIFELTKLNLIKFWAF